MLIVDASVAVKFVAAEPDSDAAAALLASPEPLLAPEWIVPEVAHALWSKVYLKELNQADAIASLDALPAFFQELRPTTELVADAYRLSFRLSHAIYDCFYLELAVREQAVLITADRKFVHAARRGGLGSHLLPLAEYRL